MKKLIAAMAVVPMIAAASVSAEDVEPQHQHKRTLIQGLFDGGILMTGQGCDVFGKHWKTFGKIAGRFPLATGNPEFPLLEDGGEYQHQLTIEEMPRHEHRVTHSGPKYKITEWGHTINGNDDAPQRIDVDDGKPWKGNTGELVAEEMGGGDLHNNMPPYLVLNFCHYVAPENEEDDEAEAGD